MENNIQVFENSEFGSVRVVEQNGEPWFIAKDVAERLGYSNPRKAVIDHVDDKYNEYRNDQLADTWAQVTLQNIGVDVAETREQL